MTYIKPTRFQSRALTQREAVKADCKAYIEAMLYRGMGANKIFGCVVEAINDFMVTQSEHLSPEQWEQFNYEIDVTQAIQNAFNEPIKLYEDKKATRKNAMDALDIAIQKIRRDYIENDNEIYYLPKDRKCKQEQNQPETTSI